ncbi:hypothetical protein AB6A40_003787 [Gnathostoma spinigerum]|uniref:DUF7087 domain-containing protein n=1 Tax=Gnathostoma spinigerum TaxID=75299 RepID=A0ABD6EAK1_9BILA
MGYQGCELIFPIVLDLLNLTHTGGRIYYDVDGSFDLTQCLNISDINLRMQYFFSYIGSFVLALITHFTVWYIDNIIYSLADLVTFFAALALTLLDTYEVIRDKLN